MLTLRGIKLINLQCFKSHRALHKVDGIVGNAFKQFVRKRQIALSDVEERLLLVITAERAEAGEKDIRQDANRPNIGFQ